MMRKGRKETESSLVLFVQHPATVVKYGWRWGGVAECLCTLCRYKNESRPKLMGDPSRHARDL